MEIEREMMIVGLLLKGELVVLLMVGGLQVKMIGYEVGELEVKMIGYEVGELQVKMIG